MITREKVVYVRPEANHSKLQFIADMIQSIVEKHDYEIERDYNDNHCNAFRLIEILGPDLNRICGFEVRELYKLPSQFAVENPFDIQRGGYKKYYLTSYYNDFDDYIHYFINLEILGGRGCENKAWEQKLVQTTLYTLEHQDVSHVSILCVPNLYEGGGKYYSPFEAITNEIKTKIRINHWGGGRPSIILIGYGKCPDPNKTVKP